MRAICASSRCFASASITGPICVAMSRGSPIGKFARGARDHLDHAVGDVVLHEQQPQRRAALAGRAKRRRHDVVGDLFGQRGRVDDHGIDAAGLRDQRHDRAVLGGERAVDRTRDFGRAGEDDAGDVGMRRQRRADAAVAGQQDAAPRRARRPHAAGERPPPRSTAFVRRVLPPPHCPPSAPP